MFSAFLPDKVENGLDVDDPTSIINPSHLWLEADLEASQTAYLIGFL